jgi:hypothetical protein
MHGRRTFLAATAAAIASVGTARCAAGRAGPAAGKTKTFVLLHGAWHGGWCWSRVAEPLPAAGHSFGGIASTGAADRIPKRIRRIVFQHSGESADSGR